MTSALHLELVMACMPKDSLTNEREFYREHLRNAFQYSGLFVAQTGRLAQEIVEKPQFDAILRDALAGSLEVARRTGEMAVVYLDGAPNQPGPWWRDLCNYERGYFMQLATTAQGPPTNRPRRGVSALCTNFTWHMPELIKRLKSGNTITDDLRRPGTLLFARGNDGTVHIVEVGPAVEKVFRLTNGPRTVDQIAATAEMPLAEVQQILLSLSGIGAIVQGKSAEEMMEILKQQNGGS